ncbi:MAG TPA: GNAT family N-acetyltransferase [Jatrophihabitans sp.]|nr:GNAT family N-acetyltransferase [Jatrophihabitans sp.]
MLSRTGDYELDDEPSRLQPDLIWNFLSTQAYWGTWRQREDLRRQLTGSYLNLGCYGPDGAQVGFARVVSDGVALAYLADVFVLPAHRGRGLGHGLVDFALAHGPSWRWLLHTKDAHGLYAGHGFGPPDGSYLERPARR